MNEHIDHERCSELLVRYVTGELDRSVAAAVSSHLEGCDECRRERAGLAALLTVPVEPLTDTERARLERRVRERTTGRPEVVAVRAPKPSPWRGRIAAALGAAALLAAVTGGVFYAGGLSGDGDSSTAPGPQGGEALEDAGQPQPSPAGGGAAPERAGEDRDKPANAKRSNLGEAAEQTGDQFALGAAYTNARVRAAAGAVLAAFGAKLPPR